MHRIRVAGPAGCLALALGLAAAASGQTVTNTNPLGPGSLHEAVTNAASGARIVFSLPAGPNSIIIIPAPNDPGPLVVGADLVSIDGSTAPGLSIQSQDVRDHLILDADPDMDDDLELRLIDVSQGVGTIKLDGTLVFETTADVTVASQIADVDTLALGGAADQRGALRKEGTATLFLNAATEYSGGTEIREGTLQAKSQAVQGDIQNGALLIIDAEQLSRIYRGSISNLAPDTPGAVEKIGAGRITLEAPQTYTGGTIIRNGTFTLDSSSGSATGALAPDAAVTVESGATLEFRLGTGMPGAYTGSWSSAGTLLLDGEDELAVLDLSGAANVSLGGAITVNQGVLAVQASAIGANVLLRDANTNAPADTPNGAVLRIHGGGNLSRVISGDGRVEVAAGSGTLTLNGVNTYKGGTRLLSGTLRARAATLPGDTDLAATTNLIFNQAATATYGGILTGAGNVEKRGTGSLITTGAHALTGTLRVSSGTLGLASGAMIGGDVTVEAGALLRGAGALGGLTTVNGRLAPVGLRVNTASFSSTSRLEYVLDPIAMTSGRLLVDGSGSVTLEAGTLIGLTPRSGDYGGAGIDFTLIDGDTGAVVTDNGAMIDGEFAFLDVTILPAGEDFIINVVGDIGESDLLGAATSPNQRSVASALFDVIDDPAGDEVRQALMTVSAEELGQVYDAAGAESISAFTSAHLATAQRFERGLHRRVRDLSWGSRASFFEVGPNPSPNLEPAAPKAGLAVPRGTLAAPRRPDGLRPAPGIGVWSDAWGVIGRIDGDGNSSDTDANLAGVSLAVDKLVGQHGVVGAALGYTFADVEVDGQETSSNAHGIQTALYGGWSEPRGYLSAAARFAWARNESERNLRVGSVSGTTQAEFDSFDYGVGFELGANLARFGLVLVQPVASFDWVRIERESFSESSGGALAPLGLNVDDDTTDSVRTGLGLRASLRYPIDKNSEVVPELRARWLHEFGDEERSVRARFRGAPAGGGAFRVAGAESGSDTFVAGLGWSVSLGKRFRVHADYDALVSSDSLAHELSIAIRARY